MPDKETGIRVKAGAHDASIRIAAGAYLAENWNASGVPLASMKTAQGTHPAPGKAVSGEHWGIMLRPVDPHPALSMASMVNVTARASQQ